MRCCSISVVCWVAVQFGRRKSYRKDLEASAEEERQKVLSDSPPCEQTGNALLERAYCTKWSGACSERNAHIELVLCNKSLDTK